MKCPACTEVLPDDVMLCDCGWRKPKSSPADEARRRNEELAARTRAALPQFTAADLTDQQWYNVCRFFPAVAEHCKRERPIVGSDHPLHGTSRAGPFMRLRAANEVYREPGQEG